MASRPLVDPYFAEFHSTASEEEGTNLAFPFLVVHENEDGTADGWVFSHDGRNTAGLSDGANWRENVGQGGPGQDVSWSPIGEEA